MEYPFVFGIIVENDVPIVKDAAGLVEINQIIRIYNWNYKPNLPQWIRR